MNILIILVLFFLQLYFYFVFGIVAIKIFNLSNINVSIVVLLGFLVYYIVFGVCALPITILCLPLSYLTNLWTFVVCFMIIISVIKYRNEKINILRKSMRIIPQHSYAGVLAIIFVGIQMLIVFTHMDGSADASYYIGKVSTDVYTNTIGQFEPYTGYRLNYLDSRRVFACFPTNNSVMSQLFSIHPIKQAKLIMPELIIVITNILYYNIGMVLFKNNRKKADIFVIFVFIINFYSYSLYSSATFLFTRTYEGKSILANLVIPGIFYCFLMLWQEEKDNVMKALMLSFAYSSCIFSSSSMLIVPVQLTAGFIVYFMTKKNFSYIKLYIMCMIPNAFVSLLYFLSLKGYVYYPIRHFF